MTVNTGNRGQHQIIDFTYETECNEIFDNIFNRLRLHDYHYVCNFSEKSSCEFHQSQKKWELRLFSVKAVTVMSNKFH